MDKVIAKVSDLQDGEMKEITIGDEKVFCWCGLMENFMPWGQNAHM